MTERKRLDFTGMKPSYALQKAHEAFPEVRWEWDIPRVTSMVLMNSDDAELCGCAVALLNHASGGSMWGDVGKVFPVPVVNPGSHYPWKIDLDSSRAGEISKATAGARSFPEAIQLLRDRGW